MKIVMRKRGKFYDVFDNDALIIHSLLKYKIIDGRVGFPENSLDKVKSILNDEHIDYKIDDIITRFEDNKYKECLIKARNTFGLEERMNAILKRIDELDIVELENLIKRIEGYLNERKAV